MALCFIPAAPCAPRSGTLRGISSPLHSGRRRAFLSKRARSDVAPWRVRTTGQPRMGTTEPSKDPTAKELAQLYGGSYLGTSIGLSIISYAVLYAMIAVGIDVRALMNAFGDWLATTPLGRPSVLDNISDTASTAALAYIAHKATSPLRFPVTIAATPIVANMFSKKDEPGES